MRKTNLILLMMIFAFTLGTPTILAADGAPKVVLDGAKMSFEVPPISENGRILVPLRAIFEALDAAVEWDQTTQTVTAVKDYTTVKLTLNAAIAFKDGIAVPLQVPAKSVNSRTLVPLRFVSEALGAEVVWDGSSNTAFIDSEYYVNLSYINDPNVDSQPLEPDQVDSMAEEIKLLLK